MTLAIAQELICIPLPDGGSLAAELFYPETGQPRSATLLCNPHPYMGGTMGNPLITAIAHALAASGGLALRFDYSGVGQSTGAPVSVAESMAAFWATGRAPLDPVCIDNARTAAEYLAQMADQSVCLAGYSFGAFVANELARPATPALAFIAPTLRQHTLSGGSAQTRVLTVYSDNDFATPVSVTEQWLSTLSPPCRTLFLPGGDHFFKGQEARVADACSDLINGSEENP